MNLRILRCAALPGVPLTRLHAHTHHALSVSPCDTQPDWAAVLAANAAHGSSGSSSARRPWWWRWWWGWWWAILIRQQTAGRRAGDEWGRRWWWQQCKALQGAFGSLMPVFYQARKGSADGTHVKFVTCTTVCLQYMVSSRMASHLTLVLCMCVAGNVAFQCHLSLVAVTDDTCRDRHRGPAVLQHWSSHRTQGKGVWNEEGHCHTSGILCICRVVGWTRLTDHPIRCFYCVFDCLLSTANCQHVVCQVLRYWPKDANRNKGDPWFTAVVTGVCVC